MSTEEKKQHKQQIYKCKTMSLQMQSARIIIKCQEKRNIATHSVINERTFQGARVKGEFYLWRVAETGCFSGQEWGR
jgi:hypothetical protein